MPSRLELLAVPGLPMVQPGDDLAAMIAERAAPLRDRDVIVIAQKIVSKAEDRAVDLATVTPSARAVELAAEVGKDDPHRADSASVEPSLGWHALRRRQF